MTMGRNLLHRSSPPICRLGREGVEGVVGVEGVEILVEVDAEAEVVAVPGFRSTSLRSRQRWKKEKIAFKWMFDQPTKECGGASTSTWDSSVTSDEF